MAGPRFKAKAIGAALALGALLSGCDRVDRVNRPLPEDFSLRGMDGTRMERGAFLGHAWVLSLWLPG